MVNWVSHRGRKTGRRGWSLIELLVVLAIISILGAISIPIMRSFARDDMRNGARTVYTMLRAARMYAMNYNVDTAVVYELDNEFFSDSPMTDSLRNSQVRCIRAAQVMYKLPDAVGLRPATTVVDAPFWDGTYIPVPTSAGASVAFPEGYALLLEEPAPLYNPNLPPTQVYKADDPSVNLWQGVTIGEVASTFLVNYHPSLDMGIEKLGMRSVYVYTDTLMDYSEGEKAYARDYVHPRMAHVFEPRGNLKIDAEPERYTLLFGPTPDTFWADRIWFVGTEPDDLRIFNWLQGDDSLSEDGGNLIGIPIEIHRATGRVTLGS